MFHSRKASPEDTGTHIFDTVLLFCVVFEKFSVVFVCETSHKRCAPHQNCSVLVSRNLNADEQAPLKRL